MRLDVHLHFADNPLARIEAKIDQVLEREVALAGELVDLQREVAETTTLIGSAITLIQGLKAALDAAIASGDPAALLALSNELDAKQTELAAAIIANTPTPTPPTP